MTGTENYKTYYETKLELAKLLNDPVREVDVLIELASADENADNFQEAVKNYKEALQVVEKLKDINKIVFILGRLGFAYFNLGNFENANETYDKIKNIIQAQKELNARKIGQTINSVQIVEEPNYYFNQPTLPNSIPTINNFVGREDYLAELREAYRKGTRCFALYGIGGAGKTATALRFAGEIMGEYAAKVFVDMQGMSNNPISAQDVMFDIVVRQFGYEVPTDIPTAQLKSLFVQLVQNQPTLIVLDNAENKESVEFVTRTNACLIITSRQALVLTGGKSIQIAAMSLEDARLLLFKIAGENRFDGRAEELASLAGYQPLALKLLAALLAQDELETAANLIEKYNKQQRLFKERVPDYENLTVRASFELSYEVFSVEMKERWRRLSVFPSDFDELAIQAVLNISADEAKETQKQLRKFSLLVINLETKRFSFPILLRTFADAKLSVNERYETTLLYAKYYASILVLAGEIKSNDTENGFINALKLIDTEWNNIAIGQKFTAEFFENDNQIAKLCTDYAGIVPELLVLRLHPREYIKWQEAGLKAAQKLEDKILQVNNFGNLGIAYLNLGEYYKAIEYYEKALTISQEIDDRRGKGSILGNLGNVYISLGEYRKAIEYLEQGLQISLQIGDRQGEGNRLGNLGIAYFNLGEYTKAIDYLERALLISRQIGDRLGEGLILGNLGRVYGSLGEYRKAIEYQEQALEISLQIGDRFGEGTILDNLGSAYYSLGEKEKACGLWKEALVIFEAMESPEANLVRQLIEENRC